MLDLSGTSHPFDDTKARGYVRAEGWGALVLRRLGDAEQDGNRIVARLLNAVAGSAGAADGKKECPPQIDEGPRQAGRQGWPIDVAVVCVWMVPIPGATEGVGRMYESPCAFGIRELMKTAYRVGEATTQASLPTVNGGEGVG